MENLGPLERRGGFQSGISFLEKRMVQGWNLKQIRKSQESLGSPLRVMDVCPIFGPGTDIEIKEV